MQGACLRVAAVVGFLWGMKLIALHEATHETLALVAAGQLIQVAGGFACDRAEWEALAYYEQQEWRVRAAGLSVPEAVLVGKSAARIHGLWVLSAREEEVELTLPAGGLPRRMQWSAGYRYRRLILADDDYREIDGLRVTSRPRACIDTARFHGFADGLVAMDSLLRQGYYREHVSLVIARMGRCKNITVARRCLELAISTSESPYESFARALLIEALPGAAVRPQVRVLPGVRVDLLVDEHVVVEIDGDVKYDGQTYRGTEETIVAERAREKQLHNAGYQVVRYSPAQLRREPERFIAEVSAARARKAA